MDAPLGTGHQEQKNSPTIMLQQNYQIQPNNISESLKDFWQNKKAMPSQGNRVMPKLFSSV